MYQYSSMREKSRPSSVSITGASQKFPTWLGPPLASSRRFQSKLPLTPPFRLPKISWAYISAFSSAVMPSKRLYSTHPSVNHSSWFGHSERTASSAPKWSPVYQCTANPDTASPALGTASVSAAR